MSKLDGLKENLSILKFWLGIIVASFLALISWLATNYNKNELFIIISSIILLFIFIFITFLINKKIKKIIKEIYKTKKDE